VGEWAKPRNDAIIQYEIQVLHDRAYPLRDRFRLGLQVRERLTPYLWLATFNTNSGRKKSTSQKHVSQRGTTDADWYDKCIWQVRYQFEPWFHIPTKWHRRR
jgi:hypothetical protein